MITVLYSCELCGIIDKPVQVPAREHHEIDVAHWMREVVGRSISLDHEQASPTCHPKSLTNIKVPLSGAEFIGQQVE